MENIIGKTFDNVSQRMLYCMLFCFSEFNFIDSQEVSVTSQKQMHSLCGNIIQSLYDNQMLLKLPVEADEYYENWMCNNQKPHLIKLLRKVYKKLYDLYHFMLLCGIHGELTDACIIVDSVSSSIKVKKAYISFLSNMGIEVEVEGNILTLKSEKYDNIFPAWILLSKESLDGQKISPKSVFDFAFCVYNRNYSYFLRRVEKVLGLNDRFLETYIEELKLKNYDIIPDRKFTANGLEVRYQFLNKSSGFIISFDYRKKNQICFSLSNGIGLKRILEDYKNQENNTKKFLCEMFRFCNGCRQCTKGKDIPIYASNVVYNGKNYLLCPLWPNASWYSMDKDRLENIIEVIELQERYTS